MSPDLRGETLRRTHLALLDAFRRVEWLDRFAAFQLDKRLGEIVNRNAPLETIVHELVDREDAEGHGLELVAKAHRWRPQNPLLLELVEQLGLSAIPRDAVNKQALVSAANRLMDFGDFLSKVQAAERRICRVELAGEPVGTGFLVGSNMVLTCFHVLPRIREKRVQRSVRLRFDYVALVGKNECRIVDEGYPCALAEAPIVALSESLEESLPVPGYLDYLLLRTAEDLGRTHLRGLDSSNEGRRDWFRVSKPEPQPTDGCSKRCKKGDVLFVFQHPLGNPLQVAPGSVLDYAGVAVQHNAETDGASSGGPCLNARLEEVIALHQGRGPGEHAKWNYALSVEHFDESARRALSEAAALR